jgi:hypothetical protein
VGKRNSDNDTWVMLDMHRYANIKRATEPVSASGHLTCLMSPKGEVVGDYLLHGLTLLLKVVDKVALLAGPLRLYQHVVVIVQ